ncbi:hypothetical protein F5B22DRAFT_645347 [Xylaria bambusicola]|uniref:uncharacterized protein n=1 Tax=Xylaria bambusicola TaxID=326684 RepID=UPI0020078A30|nr:uncharacterized protein F5B22DRAFT_645347 [Xylaria bambusicola]KAI0518096.1 hypothetical protein F5B22DRAFT_645347 [Xylaria bambusicola]
MVVTCNSLGLFLRGSHHIWRDQSQRRQNDTRVWQIGDIAFLKPYEQFNETEHLDSGRVHSKATNHPVIILDRSSDMRRFTVTTVSAYSSGEDNDYLPPWEQACHRMKDINSFRAFYGSQKPNGNSRHLHLADGKMWPKPKTSWVYIHHWSVVPASVLIQYDKPRCQLRMAPESLQDLLADMNTKSHDYQSRWTASNTIPTFFIPIEKRVKMDRSWRQDVKENQQLLSDNAGPRFPTVPSSEPRSALTPKSTNRAAKRHVCENPFSLLVDRN